MDTVPSLIPERHSPIAPRLVPVGGLPVCQSLMFPMGVITTRVCPTQLEEHTPSISAVPRRVHTHFIYAMPPGKHAPIILYLLQLSADLNSLTSITLIKVFYLFQLLEKIINFKKGSVLVYFFNMMMEKAGMLYMKYIITVQAPTPPPPRPG